MQELFNSEIINEITREVTNEDIIAYRREYVSEYIKECARHDAAFHDCRVLSRDRKNRHFSFLYSILIALISASIGFWISYLSR